VFRPYQARSTIKLSSRHIVVVLLAVAVGSCGSQSKVAQRLPDATAPVRAQNGRSSTVAVVRHVSSAPVVKEPGQLGPAWKPVASIGGQPATWIAQRSGVTLLRFNQQLVHLALHAGLGEPEGHGWIYGDRIGPSEVHHVVAAFNGGFKLSYGSVGFSSGGRVAVPLSAGLASIVTYANGKTQIGAWLRGVPARGLKVVSVLQNLHLLVDRGLVSSTATTCDSTCWGSTLGGGTDVPRSALGITGEGQLVWAAGESLSPAQIGQALAGAGVERAVELDINPEWVAGYLYVHHGGGPTAVPVVPGQLGIPGRLLAAYNRDFFTIIAN
jgi:hypothetical protein